MENTKKSNQGTNRNLLVVNLVATIISMAINYGISFFFAPYLVRVAGGEAYGFVGLANNMVNYATILTIALNSVAGRFIAIKIHEGNKKEADVFFNSTLWSNCIIALFFLIVSVPLIINLENIISIPDNLISNVKLLFVFVVLNFLISIISNVFTVSTFVTNKLYLSSVCNCVCSLIRVLMLTGLFKVFPPNVAYISITATVCSIFYALYNGILTKKLLPELKINISKFSFATVKILIGAGIWSSVTKLSQVLSDGLDLLISNIGVSSYAMGQVSIAYTIPTLMAALLSTISNLFAPQLTYHYAKGDIDSVVSEFKTNMKMTGFFVSVIFAGFVVYGREFFELWVPGQNTGLIYTLSLLAIVSVLGSGVTCGLNNVFLLTNNLKSNSLYWLCVGIFDAAVVITLVKFTSLGVYAVVGVSKIVGLISYLTYLPLYSSVCLGISKKTFYPIIVRYIINVLIIGSIFVGLKFILFNATTWVYLIADVAVVGLVGMVFNYYFFLDKTEREKLLGAVKKKVVRH